MSTEKKPVAAKAEKTAATATPAKTAGKKSVRRKKKRKAGAHGKAFIRATFNNTIITITEANGEVIAWASSGGQGFKGTRKSTPYAAQVAANVAATKAVDMGMREVEVFINGIGVGRESSVRAIAAAGLDVVAITDSTPVPHNGCRPSKPRRV
ncbi:MAG: 30S ribosomal protein S11 [bacterium]